MGFRDRRARRRAEWEQICNRCGLCCYDRKRTLRGRVAILWKRPCPYLKISNGLCTVYDKRLSVCKDCRKVTIFHALFDSYMPESCAYVQRFRPFARRRKPPIPAEE